LQIPQGHSRLLTFGYRIIIAKIMRFSACMPHRTLRGMSPPSSSSSACTTALAASNPSGVHRASGAAPFLWGNALLGSIGLFLHQAQAGALTATWARSAFGLLGLTLWLLWRR